jgi:hypothetical protein
MTGICDGASTPSNLAAPTDAICIAANLHEARTEPTISEAPLDPGRTHPFRLRRIAGLLMLVPILVLLSGSRPFAHSWYAPDCCSGQDCTPADALAIDIRGDFEVRVGVWVPRGFAVRPTKDDRIHICYRRETEPSFLLPICLFLPPEG